MNPSAVDMIFRLGLSACLGGLIGLEREMDSQPAGLRTHMVVAIGSALLMIISLKSAAQVPGTDPGRIAAQVVSGIGFLGAGAIMRFGMSIKGLTTAACLWTAAGIGLACGMGYWEGAVAATLMVFAALFFVDKIEKRFIVGKAVRRFVIRAKDSPGLFSSIQECLLARGLEIRQVGIHRDGPEHKMKLTFMTDSPEGVNLEALSQQLCSLPDVESVDIE